MNRKVYRLFSAVMVLVMAVTLSGIGLIQGSAPASAITALKWTEISTPGEDDLQLFPGSDVGAIAVSPDGATLFAAVSETSAAYPPGGPAGDGWRVFKSIDGGYTWSETGFFRLISPTDTSAIVEICTSPLWENKQYLYVATLNNVYWSSDGGNNFARLGGDLSGYPDINCIDVGVDEDGMVRVVVGTGGAPDGIFNADVYLLVYDTWVPQQVHVGLNSLAPAQPVDAVLDVAFAPTYGDAAMAGQGFGWIFALVRGLHFAPPYTVDQAVLRCETQAAETIGGIGNWGAPVQDCYFYHNSAPECAVPGNAWGILATRGRMAFADDFADQQSVFVGMTAWDPGCVPPGGFPRGDAFRVDVGTGIIYPSTYEDLNIRGSSPSPTECNVWSIDVSGDASTAYILVGLHETSTSGAPSSWQSGVHFSDNGGTTWMPSFKPPSGVTDMGTQWNAPELAMAPDFGTSGIAYCGTYGAFSGLWVSTKEGTTWNGRGLLDMATISISSIAVSPNYATDQNMFMVQQMTLVFSPAPYNVLNPLGILWETKDAGSHWEVILAMNALFPLPGVRVEWVELPHNWPADDALFVTGRMSVQPSAAQSVIIRSNDGGDTFTTFINGPKADRDAAIPGDEPQPPFTGASWDTPDVDTIFIGDQYGDVFYTDNAGSQWHRCESSAIPIGNNPNFGESISDLVEKDGALLIGTAGRTGIARAGVYICYDWQADFTIARVGDYVGATNDWTSVAFDASYDLNDTIYCGLYDTVATGNGEVRRCNLGEGTTWEQISDIANTLVPEGWGLPAGTLFGPMAGSNEPMWVGSWNGLDPILPGQGGNALMCGEEGTLYALDVHNGLGWRTTDPRLETIHLGDEPLWEPLGDGLGWPSAILNAKVLSDLEVVTGTNILFAIGRDGANLPTIWTYHDTLTSSLGPLDLIQPADGATGVGTLAADKTQACLVLQWEPATDATQYEWEIGTSPELKVDGGFKSRWAHYAFLGQAAPLDTQRFTNGEAIPGCLPPGETYYWHVRVVQPFQSPWSEIWSFTTLYTSASEKPVPLSPTGGIGNVSLKPTLQWLGALDADKYELVVALECNWGSPIIEKSGDNALGAETAYQITQNLQYGKNYCWKVRAIKGATASVWSDTGTFTTMAQPAEVVEEGTPFWVWVVIGVSALMLVAVIVLIVLTKKT